MKYVLIFVMLFAAGCVNARTQQAVITDVFPRHEQVIVDNNNYHCRQYRQHSDGDVIAGAIIGGLIGNQFGNGNGKTAMTALGAIVGADSMLSQNSVACNYRGPSREIRMEFVGYDVTYYLNGRYYTFFSRDRYRLGDYILVNH